MFSMALSRSVTIDCDKNWWCAAIPLGKSYVNKSLYSSYLSSLFFLASSISFCRLCLSSSLSAGDSRKAGGARNVAGGGGTLLPRVLAISSFVIVDVGNVLRQ